MGQRKSRNTLSVRAEGKIVVTDIFGLGAAAKSAAGKEIGKAFANVVGALVDPGRSLLMGLAKTKVEANKITAIAKAEAKSQKITIASEQLIERMKQRVIATEIKRQINVEAATVEAISLVEKNHSQNDGRPIKDDWMYKWIDGAQAASAGDVRKLWSRVLATQSLKEKETVSKPSLSLLQSLDSTLATALEDYIAFRFVYGAYPKHGKINPELIPDRQLNILIEIGFLASAMQHTFVFDDFELRLGHSGRIASIHSTVDLTTLGHELCVAIFEEEDPFNGVLQGRLPLEQLQIQMLIKLINEAREEDRETAFLLFKMPDEAHVAEVSIPKHTPENPLRYEQVAALLAEHGAIVSTRANKVLTELARSGMIEAINKADRRP